MESRSRSLLFSIYRLDLNTLTQIGNTNASMSTQDDKR